MHVTNRKNLTCNNKIQSLHKNQEHNKIKDTQGKLKGQI